MSAFQLLLRMVRPASPWLCALVCIGIAACHRDQESSASLLLFGTVIEVKIWGATPEQSKRAFADLRQMFEAMHRDWHAWEPGQLTALNEAFAQGRSAHADEGIMEMIRRSQALEERTAGRFNPAIGALIRLWGFHTSEFPIRGPPPTQAEIESILRHRPSTQDLMLQGRQLRSENPFVQLDLGGIAKGYAVDLAIEHLQELNLTNALVNAGGDLRAMGSHGARPWRVAVRDPIGGILGAVEVSGNEALFTSGNYERFLEHSEERYSHILDPRTGWPVKDVASVTVLAHDGLLADAAATAMVVAGLDHWQEVARRLELDQVLVVDEAGQVYLTRDMARRVKLAEDIEPVIVELGSEGASLPE